MSPSPSINAWRPWAYAPGHTVSHGGKLWQAKRATSTTDIPGNSDAWEVHILSGTRVSKALMAEAVDPRIGSGI